MIRSAPSLAGLALAAALAACGPKAPEPPPKPAEAPKVVIATPPPVDPNAEVKPEPPPKFPDIAQNAIEVKFTPSYKQCLATGEAAAGVTTAMSACVKTELAAQEKALVAELQRALTVMTPAKAAGLKIAEDEWVKARDERCKMVRQGGTMDDVTYPACQLGEVVQRTIQLQSIQ